MKNLSYFIIICIITNIHLLSVRNINFPCKTYLKSNVSLDILEERKNSLEAFLESILRIIRLENNVELKPFLSVVSTPANNKQATSQLLKVQPSYEVKFYLTKIQDYIQIMMMVSPKFCFNDPNGIYS